MPRTADEVYVIHVSVVRAVVQIVPMNSLLVWLQRYTKILNSNIQMANYIRIIHKKFSDYLTENTSDFYSEV